MSGVSPRWEAVPPSGRVADIVAGTDLSVHSDDGVLSVIAATEKAMSWLQAVQVPALAEFARRRPTDEFAGEPAPPADNTKNGPRHTFKIRA